MPDYIYTILELLAYAYVVILAVWVVGVMFFYNLFRLACYIYYRFYWESKCRKLR